MTEIDPTITVAAAVITGLGLLFTVAGYDLKNVLLAWIGWIAGGILGGLIGWMAVPDLLDTTLAIEEHLIAVAGGVFIGAFIGRMFISLVAQLAVALTAFVSAVLATLIFAVGDEILDSLSIPDEGSAVSRAELFFTDLAELQLLTDPELQQFVAIAIILGLVAAIVSIRYYGAIMAITLTGFGAAILSAVYPIWEAIITESTVVVADQAEPSPLIFAGVLTFGLIVQALRHSDALSSDDSASNY